MVLISSLIAHNVTKFFPNLNKHLLSKIVYMDIPTIYACNHCVNNWGLDLCACGSGETPEECDGEFEECGRPMQNLDLNQPHVRGNGSWM